MDAADGYRNGYGQLRRLAMSLGTITVRRPRVRGLEERFESRVLPLFLRKTREVGTPLPELYLHGLTEGDFELAARAFRPCTQARRAAHEALVGRVSDPKAQFDRISRARVPPEPMGANYG